MKAVCDDMHVTEADHRAAEQAKKVLYGHKSCMPLMCLTGHSRSDSGRIEGKHPIAQIHNC